MHCKNICVWQVQLLCTGTDFTLNSKVMGKKRQIHKRQKNQTQITGSSFVKTFVEQNIVILTEQELGWKLPDKDIWNSSQYANKNEIRKIRRF